MAEAADLNTCIMGQRMKELEKCQGEKTLFSQLSHEQKEACSFLAFRSETNIPESSAFCQYHKHLSRKFAKERYCCNPFSDHSNKREKQQKISTTLARTLWNNDCLANPGQWLCKSCYAKANKLPVSATSSVVCAESNKEYEPAQESTDTLDEPPQILSSSHVSMKTPDRGKGIGLSSVSLQKSPDLFADAEQPSTSFVKEVPKCFVGHQFQEICASQPEIILAEDRKTLSLVLQFEIPDGATVCSLHRTLVLEKRYLKNRSCINPFRSHGERKKSYNVSNELSSKLLMHGFNVKPQDALCRDCYAKANSLEAHEPCVSSEDSSQTPRSHGELSPTSSQSLSGTTQQERAKIDLENIIKAAQVAPISLAAWHSGEKKTQARAKYTEVKEAIKKKKNCALDINLSSDDEADDIKQKAKDLDGFVDALKCRVKNAGYNEKLKLLTLVPLSWSISKVSKEFEVARSTAKTSRKLRLEGGILALPAVKEGRPLDDTVVQKVLKFYNDSEYSRECPGIKECVSVGKGVKKQKRLLLANLDELYSLFKKEHPELKIGRTKFCEARPKWCILLGSSGTHVVCVCKYHQNVKLLLDAIGMRKEEYKDLINKIICPDETRDCRLGVCLKCPTKSNVKQIISTVVQNKVDRRESDDEDDFEERAIQYKQWLSTDRVNLETRISPLPEFVTTFTHQLLELIPHDFVAKEQAAYFKNLKESLPPNKLVVQLDFSENYAFCVQDEIQSHHFSKGSCTVHPVTIHFKDEESGEIKCLSLCYLSEDLRHDVGFVDALQEDLIFYIKEHFPNVTEIEYVSDGCAAQYKNCKAFLNLCNHKARYGISATWSFYATSHGKSQCDSIGATVKRCARQESLKRVSSKDTPINTVTELYRYCKTREANGSPIKHRLLDKVAVAKARDRIKALNPPTLPGTRSYHSFSPLSTSVIACKLISRDQSFALVFDFEKGSSIETPPENCFGAFSFGGTWLLAFIRKANDNEGEASIILLTRITGKEKLYDWRDDKEISTPYSNFLCKVEVAILEKGIKLVTSTHKINKCMGKT